MPFVAVHWVGRIVGAGLSWDTHSGNFEQLKNTLLPPFDSCYSALIADLSDRGLLDETLVVVCAEMGRTPKVGDPRPGGTGCPRPRPLGPLHGRTLCRRWHPGWAGLRPV